MSKDIRDFCVVVGAGIISIVLLYLIMLLVCRLVGYIFFWVPKVIHHYDVIRII